MSRPNVVPRPPCTENKLMKKGIRDALVRGPTSQTTPLQPYAGHFRFLARAVFDDTPSGKAGRLSQGREVLLLEGGVRESE